MLKSAPCALLVASVSLFALRVAAADAAAPAPAAAAPTATATAAAPADAHTAPAAEGLKSGTPAPVFVLPVVNEAQSTVKKWGPARWTGKEAAEPKKLVVMSFFATYCEPCKKEMPELQRLYEAYKDQGLGVMLVSIDKGDEQKQTIIDLAKLNKVTFPVMHDRFQMVARRYSAERLPYMLMLDTNGTIQTVHTGYTDELKAGLEQEVRAGLGLPPLAPETKSAKKGAKQSTKPAAAAAATPAPKAAP